MLDKSLLTMLSSINKAFIIINNIKKKKKKMNDISRILTCILAFNYLFSVIIYQSLVSTTGQGGG